MSLKIVFVVIRVKYVIKVSFVNNCEVVNVQEMELII